MRLEVGRMAISAKKEGIEMQNPPKEWELVKCFTPYNKLSEKSIRASLMTAEFQQEVAEPGCSVDDLMAMPAMQRMNSGARGALTRRLNKAKGNGNERPKATNYFRDRTQTSTVSQRNGDKRHETFRRGFKKIMQRGGSNSDQRQRYKKLDDFESHVDRIVDKRRPRQPTQDPRYTVPNSAALQEAAFNMAKTKDTVTKLKIHRRSERKGEVCSSSIATACRPKVECRRLK